VEPRVVGFGCFLHDGCSFEQARRSRWDHLANGTPPSMATAAPCETPRERPELVQFGRSRWARPACDVSVAFRIRLLSEHSLALEICSALRLSGSSGSPRRFAVNSV
jgi:hypothetical protein